MPSSLAGPPWSIVLMLAASVAACSPQRAGSAQVAETTVAADSPAAGLVGNAKRRWIAKASRVLRYGKQVSLAEMSDLLPLGQDEVVQRLMQDPDFADTVLDFNLFFLGFKVDPLYSSFGGKRNYDFRAMAFLPAVASAVEAFNGKNYLALLSRRFPIYAAPVTPSLTKAVFNERLATVAAAFAENEGIDRAKLCQLYQSTQTAFTMSAFPSAATQGLVNGGQVTTACFSPNSSAALIMQLITKFQADMNKLYDSLDPSVVDDKSGRIALYKPLKVDGDAPDRSATYFPNSFWSRNVNSSTNRNRKRAATILKTYFCDDLTPLNIVAASDVHGVGAHASDPSCQACHYKLDPMAGFFRNNARGGQPATGAFFTFDDNLKITGADIDTYMSGWKAKPDSGHEWDVGYIRSTKPEFASLNDYGSTIADLLDVTARAPEVKQCLVERMAEYFLGAGQVYDGNWTRSLAKTLTTAEDSSQAFRSVVSRLVLSATFIKDDPDPGQCYDFAPDTAPSTLPCGVAFVIKQNCVSCHKSTSGAGGLDLGEWVDQGPGKSYFKHLRDGQQVARAESLKAIMERLNTSDADLAMPLGKFMPAQDRAKLYQWVNSEVSP